MNALTVGTTMEVVQDVPGYKTILRTVLRQQIQQLVEQLSQFTDEETVVLSANLSDGTLSHLGSKTGNIFLEKEKEIKTRFLGFCLNSSSDSVITGNLSNGPVVSYKRKEIVKTRKAKRKSKKHFGSVQIKSQKTDVNEDSEDLHTKPESASSHVTIESHLPMTDTCSVNNETEVAASKTNEYVDYSVFKVKDEIDTGNVSDVSVESDYDLNTEDAHSAVVIDDKSSTIQEADLQSSSQPDTSTRQLETRDQETSDSRMKDDPDNSIKGPELTAGRSKNVTFKIKHSDTNEGVTPVFRVQRCKNSVLKIQQLNTSKTVKIPLETPKERTEGTKKINHMCDQCGQGFRSRYGLKSHVNSKHNNIFRFTCEKCGKGFQGLWNFRSHQHAHNAKNDIKQRKKCSLCPKTYIHKSSLIDHERSHLDFIAQPITSCKVCGIDFKDEKSRKEHERGAHGGKVYTCKICLKTFRWRSSLAYHMKHINH